MKQGWLGYVVKDFFSSKIWKSSNTKIEVVTLVGWFKLSYFGFRGNLKGWCYWQLSKLWLFKVPYARIKPIYSNVRWRRVTFWLWQTEIIFRLVLRQNLLNTNWMPSLSLYKVYTPVQRKAKAGPWGFCKLI